MAAPNTAIEKAPRIQEYIRSKEIMQRFSDLLGSNGAAGYVQSVLLAVSDSKALMNCTPNSVISCALRAATMKLSCDPTTKQAYLVPFKKSIKNELGVWSDIKVATLIVGYMGFYQMAIRTGKYRYINVYAVAGDQEVTLNPITGFHSIHGIQGDKTKIIGYLGAFEMTNGYGKTIYMTIEELIAHGQQYSSSYSDPKGKWQTAPHDMYKKTIMRMLLIHWGYLDPHDVSLVNQMDEAVDHEDALSVTPMEPEEKRTEAQNLTELGYEAEEHKTTEVKADYVAEPEEVESMRQSEDPAPEAPAPEQAQANGTGPREALRLAWPIDAAVSWAMASTVTAKSGKKTKLYIDLDDKALEGCKTHFTKIIDDARAFPDSVTPEQLAEAQLKLTTAVVILEVRQPQ